VVGLDFSTTTGCAPHAARDVEVILRAWRAHRKARKAATDRI
jgi:hypothetical protein